MTALSAPFYDLETAGDITRRIAQPPADAVEALAKGLQALKAQHGVRELEDEAGTPNPASIHTAIAQAAKMLEDVDLAALIDDAGTLVATYRKAVGGEARNPLVDFRFDPSRVAVEGDRATVFVRQGDEDVPRADLVRVGSRWFLSVVPPDPK